MGLPNIDLLACDGLFFFFFGFVLSIIYMVIIRLVSIGFDRFIWTWYPAKMRSFWIIFVPYLYQWPIRWCCCRDQDLHQPLRWPWTQPRLLCSMLELSLAFDSRSRISSCLHHSKTCKIHIPIRDLMFLVSAPMIRF